MVEPRRADQEIARERLPSETSMNRNADSQKKRIIIIDDHPPTREWLVALINLQSDLKVCGWANNTAEALDLIAATRPHLAIVEISLEGASGIDLIKKISGSTPTELGMEVMVLSVHDEVPYLERALRAGAGGYVTKGEATEHALPAIRCVLEGKLYLSNRWAAVKPGKAVRTARPGMNSQIAALSERELEVFQLLWRCSGTRQIAEELQISYKTVQTFCARIKAKLKLANVDELLREAVRWHDSQ
jgi:DNA-binding NarL/FixJ family response regulator